MRGSNLRVPLPALGVANQTISRALSFRTRRIEPNRLFMWTATRWFTMSPPPEKQGVQVVDNQRNVPVLFLGSLPPPGGVEVLTNNNATLTTCFPAG